MPYKSRAQQRWAHTPAGEKALGGPAKVHEWDQVSKGHYGSLPEHVSTHAGGGVVSNKGYLGKSESFAAGGPVLGRTTDFMKTPDTFRGSLQPNPPNQASDENWGKGAKGPKGDGGPAAPSGKDKSEKPVLPRK